MNKILLTLFVLSLLTAFPTRNDAETFKSNAVKTPPTDMKAPPTEPKTAPTNAKVPQTEVKTPQVHLKAVPGATSRDNEDTQSTLPVPQPCQGIPSDVKVDSRVQTFLGCKIIRILAQPERVESFRLKPEPNASLPEKNRLGNYPIEDNGQGRNLTNAQIKDLQKLFFSENSYYFYASKRCPFSPDIGLHFVRGEQSVEVLFSFDCNLWLFFDDGDEKLEDFDSVQEQLLKLGHSLFQ